MPRREILGLRMAEFHGRELREDYILVIFCFSEICELGLCNSIKGKHGVCPMLRLCDLFGDWGF